MSNDDVMNIQQTGVLPLRIETGRFHLIRDKDTKIASYRRQKPQPSQWVRLERAFAENPCIGLSDGEFKILKIPKP